MIYNPEARAKNLEFDGCPLLALQVCEEASNPRVVADSIRHHRQEAQDGIIWSLTNPDHILVTLARRNRFERRIRGFGELGRRLGQSPRRCR